MANQKTQKAKAKKEEKEPLSIEEQIEVLEAPLAVDRVLTHPVTGEEKTFVQHEMGFLTKLKFFRLLSGSLRVAASGREDGVVGLLNDTINTESTDVFAANDFATTLMRIVEVVPDVMEETFIYALNIKPQDQLWASEALETIDDEMGTDIIDVFIGQNAKAVQDFFSKHLRKLQARATKEFGQTISDLDMEQESETTT